MKQHRFLAAVLAGIVIGIPTNVLACGMFLPSEGNGQVMQERVLIRWDGAREDLLMEFNVDGSSREAAWVLPVPAEATVKLGPSDVFDALQTLTKPQVRVEKVGREVAMGGAGADTGAAAVTVLEQQRLGPFEVTTLAAHAADALEAWLANNGYTLPAGIGDLLKPYVDRHWFYVAVRLVPGSADGTLQGKLDPLWVSFDTASIIYPIRPSKLAKQPFAVFMYVLADHRVNLVPSFAGQNSWINIRYAQWVDPAGLEATSPLRPFVPHRLFLTKFEGFIYPTDITDDWTLAIAQQDNLYHEEEVQYVYDPALDESKRSVTPEAQQADARAPRDGGQRNVIADAERADARTPRDDGRILRLISGLCIIVTLGSVLGIAWGIRRDFRAR